MNNMNNISLVTIIMLNKKSGCFTYCLTKKKDIMLFKIR